MIWHLYGKNEKVIITDSPVQLINSCSPTYIHSPETVTEEESSSEESDNLILKKAYSLPDSNSLFLNFSSDSNTKTSKNKKRELKTKSIKVNGVNILNRKNLDSKTIAERIQKRRENHNYLERRRRDCMNNTIEEISRILPTSSLPEGQKSNKHSVLKSALNYIMFLQSENQFIKRQKMQLEARHLLEDVNIQQAYPSPSTPYEPRI